jgi:hypothetical protein
MLDDPPGADDATLLAPPRLDHDEILAVAESEGPKAPLAVVRSLVLYLDDGSIEYPSCFAEIHVAAAEILHTLAFIPLEFVH